jgi:hypothetical protein
MRACKGGKLALVDQESRATVVWRDEPKAL